MFILKCWLELAASLSLFYLILGILFSVLCHMAQTKVKTDYVGRDLSLDGVEHVCLM